MLSGENVLGYVLNKPNNFIVFKSKFAEINRIILHKIYIAVVDIGHGGRYYQPRDIHTPQNLQMGKKDTLHGVSREDYSHAGTLVDLQGGPF